MGNTALEALVLNSKETRGAALLTAASICFQEGENAHVLSAAAISIPCEYTLCALL